MTITFVSCSFAVELDHDLPLLVEAARQRGIDAEITVWDDPTIDWTSYDAVIVRSCWDYITQREAFLAWAASVPRLHNSHEVLAWNTDKVYLRQIEAAGVPIIETRWNVADGDDLGEHAEWVVKPTVSAGSLDTARWESPADVYAHSSTLVGAGTYIDDPALHRLGRRRGRDGDAVLRRRVLARDPQGPDPHPRRGHPPGPRRSRGERGAHTERRPSTRSQRPRWPRSRRPSATRQTSSMPASTW